ncbi:MAG: right-handed parallel beta-helix repeat-containing protein [Desulfobacteraceae bacterium]|nr:right-handed parallel beta-helix repeat-containing protein [Desulfobacteraceae bacterium]
MMKTCDVKQNAFMVIVWIMGLFLLFTSFNPVANAASYYVSASGNDDNAGSRSNPWKTIQYAADSVSAGDTVYIRSGTYRERVTLSTSGSSGKYITFTAYGNETVNIDGSNITLPQSWGGLFDISDVSYIIVSKLRIKNAGPYNNSAGILVDNGSYITLQNNYIYNTVSSGIGAWNSSNITIDNNEVVLACNDGEQECITVAGTTTFVIKNNTVHDSGPGTNGGEGIDAKDGSSNGSIYSNTIYDINRLGIYVDSWDKNTKEINIYQNTVYDCKGDGFTVAAESGGLLEDITIYNNVAYGNSDCGISISRNGGSSYSHPMDTIKVINNTFYNNGSGTWGGGIYIDNPEAQGVVIKNNIVSQNLSFQIAAESDVSSQNYSVSYNLVEGYRNYSGEVYGTNYIDTSPQFTSTSTPDFHLLATSPAIDQATSTDAPSTDYDGTARPQPDQSSGYDMGAYEYSLCYGTPSAATITSPSGTIQDTTPTFIWAEDTCITWYMLYIWDSGHNQVLSQWYEASSICDSGSCSVTLSNHLSNESHEWFVKSWNNYGSTWTSGTSFTVDIDDLLPSKITLVSPSGSTTGTSPVFTWIEDTNATWYKIYISHTDAGGKFVQWYEIEDNYASYPEAACSGGQCTVTVSEAMEAGSHTWYMLGWNEYGNGQWSSAMTFSIAE